MIRGGILTGPPVLVRHELAGRDYVGFDFPYRLITIPPERVSGKKQEWYIPKRDRDEIMRANKSSREYIEMQLGKVGLKVEDFVQRRMFELLRSGQHSGWKYAMVDKVVELNCQEYNPGDEYLVQLRMKLSENLFL